MGTFLWSPMALSYIGTSDLRPRQVYTIIIAISILLLLIKNNKKYDFKYFSKKHLNKYIFPLLTSKNEYICIYKINFILR